MGRNRKPTAILDAVGAFIINPQRKRPNEPKSDRPLGTPPKYLSKEEKKIWKEIAKRLLPGVGLESDRDAFELMVKLTYRMRTNDPNMLGADRNLLVSLWSRFAMTPADRSKVTVDNPKESALSTFMKRRKEASAPPAEQTPTVN